MTAPDFRPFEQKFKGKRHLGPAQFLRSEEGGEWDEGSESESESESEDDDDDEYSEPKQKLPVRKSEREQLPDRLKYPERFISIK